MTSSKGSITLTSSGSKRSRDAMLANARRRRSRAKSALASALGRPLSGMGAGKQDRIPTVPSTQRLRREHERHLQALLERHDGGRVRRVRGEAVAIERGEVVLRGGARLEADAVVLATGISPPAAVRGPVGHPAYVADPWDRDAVASLADRDEVLIVGTGLTMADVALTLSGGPRLTAVSRNGELPRCHRAGLPKPGAPAVRPGETTSADALAERVDALAAAFEWRTVVDSLRPVTQELWRSLPVTEKVRFLERHARRWEVHRHRLAPQVAERLRALMTGGRLRVAAGGVGAIEPAGDRLAVEAGGRRVLFDGVVNATGPAWDCRHGTTRSCARCWPPGPPRRARSASACAPTPAARWSTATAPPPAACSRSARCAVASCGRPSRSPRSAYRRHSWAARIAALATMRSQRAA